MSLNPSVLFALKTTSAPFVEPRKSLVPIVFPESVHPVLAPAEAAAQRAFPEASEVRTYPFDAHERILRPWKVPVPTTSSLEVGVMVPIPTRPFAIPLAPIPVP